MVLLSPMASVPIAAATGTLLGDVAVIWRMFPSSAAALKRWAHSSPCSTASSLQKPLGSQEWVLLAFHDFVTGKNVLHLSLFHQWELVLVCNKLADWHCCDPGLSRGLLFFWGFLFVCLFLLGVSRLVPLLLLLGALHRSSHVIHRWVYLLTLKVNMKITTSSTLFCLFLHHIVPSGYFSQIELTQRGSSWFCSPLKWQCISFTCIYFLDAFPFFSLCHISPLLSEDHLLWCASFSRRRMS